MEIGLMILAGGKSSRMGEDKAFLSLAGQSFLERTIEKGKAYGFTDILVVINRKLEVHDATVMVVSDIYSQSGPLGGIHAGLVCGRKPVYFVVSCDMPLLDFAVVETLRAQLQDDVMAAAPVHEGKVQPLAALYRIECAAVIEKMLLSENERRVMKLYERINARMVDCGEFSSGFFNVNTPEAYMAVKAKYVNAARKTPIVSIAAARSGTGKTTLLEKLIPALKKYGLRIAVLKSDGHGFEFDHQGKDTWKFSRAGADAVAIVASERYAIVQRTPVKESLENVAQKIEHVDLILIESREHGIFPVLEIMRAGVSDCPVTKEENLVAILTDIEGVVVKRPVLPLNEPEKIAAFILSLI